ncbi:uncharacterized protein B0H18DRAFT_1008717 [Fomitopsis serialis]|uniref:uncharacterized protein n=1 Tax=Fomitopsis serialis TaxID=139415 RepID=UPI002008EB26|nr:uncharacterized protein B0H18DRAFT_1008717 [Neoantrodia serialis]KAH9925496.1 hypothetical protein B0H18DRAFT_1008717 [Neoantrodia serialis]
MRESNFAFPAQNRACVCISSQLYDRRALDTNSPLPLFNSLTHLTYLTSTSPRIREIMTMDGGLERLVRILHDFCICPPPPENPMLFYGLSPPSAHPPKLVPTLNPKSFDKQAQYRFTLAFQCIVNIGVRGSEFIRSRVVQAGTLDVVGCILEAWLAGRGFAVGPSVSASGLPRETKEQRLARRQAQMEARQREQADQLARALQQQVIEPSRRLAPLPPEDEPMEAETTSRADTPADSSANPTPGGINTPTGSGRERSGTIIARPAWDPPAGPVGGGHTHRRTYRRRDPPPESAGASTSTSADNSRPETETEDDGDVDMDQESAHGDEASTSGTPPPERRGPPAGTIRAPTVHTRRTVGIVSDAGNPATTGSLDMDNDVHIVINGQGDGGVEGVGVEDGLVSMETNDDFAMGAPPGAPGAIDGPPARIGPDPPMPGERTPRAPTTALPHAISINVPPVPSPNIRVTTADPPTTRAGRTHVSRGTNTGGAGGNAGAGAAGGSHGHHHHHHARESEGPYRDEDVLLSLQLLAYLSKYPHVRQAFYKPRTTFHPATAQLPVGDGRFASSSSAAGPSNKAGVGAGGFGPIGPAKEPNSFIRAYNTVTGRGKEKAPASPEPAAPIAAPPTPQRMTNVFALVERFTFRHSSVDMESSNPPPSLPPEIQYWAGVIMRNACRKDDSRGGIRQCANMLCGRWESFPREFAKCRRCRKAKYCGKECQSLAWSEGHRFWCSAKDPEEDAEHHAESSRTGQTTSTGTVTADGTPVQTGRHERRAERERERHTRTLATEVLRQERREQMMVAVRMGGTLMRPGAPGIDLGIRDGVTVVSPDETPNDGAGPARVNGNPDDMMLG